MQHDLFAVIGNPIAHSLSPAIYLQFAQQFPAIRLSYEKILGDEIAFESQVRAFFQQGGRGVNITAPFKRRAYMIADILTDRALASESVNSLLMLPDGRLEGDNSDGVGLIRDMTRYVSLSQKNILVLGAGAVVEAVLPAILGEYPASISLVNRDINKALQIGARFPIVVKSYENIAGVYDVVINATPLSLQKTLPPIKADLLGAGGFAYDMVYDRLQDTVFVAWARAQGMQAIHGLGMLLEQAAENFYRWYGVLPDIC